MKTYTDMNDDFLEAYMWGRVEENLTDEDMDELCRLFDALSSEDGTITAKMLGTIMMS